MRKTETNTDRRALRVKDAATYLSVSRRHIRWLVQHGHLPLIKLPGTEDSQHAPWLIDRRKLDSLVDDSQVTLS